jgi:hypothetical protein
MSKKKNVSRTKELLDEAFEQHRLIKTDLLTLMGKFEQPNMTKEKLKDELFKLYKKIK